MTNLLYALVIDNKHGTDVSLYKTMQKLEASLYDYVVSNWEHSECLIKYTPEQAIERYFHDAPWTHDWYEVRECKIEV